MNFHTEARKSEDIPLEDRAHVIFTTNSVFIENEGYDPSRVSELYYHDFALKAPKGIPLETIAEVLAGTTSPQVVPEFGLTPMDFFTPDPHEAMDFHRDEVAKYVERFNLRYAPQGVTFQSKTINKQFYPF